MAARLLLNLFVFIVLFLSVHAKGIRIKSICRDVFPVVNNTGPGCSIPAFVNPEEFGDNLQSSGSLSLRRTSRGTILKIDVKGLPRPDLVLTAWIIWADPTADLPEVFDIASNVSPAAPSFGHFTAGLDTEANSLRYISKDRAVLRTRLDFDPTKPNEGPLVGGRASFQSDIPGIQSTAFKQFEATPDGRFIPITANFLRVFEENGFQNLDSRGRPELVRSPFSALGIAVAAHTDRTTHGLSPGLLNIDHFEVLFFDLASTS